MSGNWKFVNDVNVLGMKKDIVWLWERVYNFMEKVREMCWEIGEGVK